MTTLERPLWLLVLIALVVCAGPRVARLPEFGLCDADEYRECFCIKRDRAKVIEPPDGIEEPREPAMLTSMEALEMAVDMWPDCGEQVSAGVR